MATIQTEHADHTDLPSQLLEAALGHVPFDGWSDLAFNAAVADCGLDPVLAGAVCPRGAVDLAVAYHHRGDAVMVARLQSEDMSDLKFREKISAGVRFRLEACEDKEVIRRGSVLFALPKYAATGGQLVWGTCDAIWTALGDTSDDINWYTKRATLSAVYGATVLYWLGDESQNHVDTWAFLDRRIENVMQFEKVKSGFKSSAFGKLMAGPLAALSRVQPPEKPTDMPGKWNRSS